MTSASPFQRLIDLAASAKLRYASLCELAAATGVTPPALLDQLSLHVARAYADKALTFHEADGIANSAYDVVMSTEFLNAHGELPGLTLAVYVALDSGEFQRPKDPPDTDPAEKYARPAILEVLEDVARGHIQ